MYAGFKTFSVLKITNVDFRKRVSSIDGLFTFARRLSQVLVQSLYGSRRALFCIDSILPVDLMELKCQTKGQLLKFENTKASIKAFFFWKTNVFPRSTNSIQLGTCFFCIVLIPDCQKSPNMSKSSNMGSPYQDRKKNLYSLDPREKIRLLMIWFFELLPIRPLMYIHSSSTNILYPLYQIIVERPCSHFTSLIYYNIVLSLDSIFIPYNSTNSPKN